LLPSAITRSSLHSPRKLSDMSKKHITNDPKHLVIDALKGVVALNPNVELDEEYKGWSRPRRPGAELRRHTPSLLMPLGDLLRTVIYRTELAKDKVAIISGGGGGHE
jgi:dihydroxyacetone kinase